MRLSATARDDDRQDHVARLAQHAVGVEEEQRRAEDQRDAEAAAVDVREAAPRASAVGSPGPTRRASGARRARPARPATRASATGARSGRRRRRRGSAARRTRRTTRARARAGPAGRARVRKQTPAATRQLADRDPADQRLDRVDVPRARVGVALVHEDPGEHVGAEGRAAGHDHREHEADPDQDRVDAKAAGETRADAGDDRVGRSRVERGGRGGLTVAGCQLSAPGRRRCR